MSIFRGLKKIYNLITSEAGTIEQLEGKTDTEQKTASVYAYGNKKYSYHSDFNNVATFPMQNINDDLVTRPLYIYSLICKDAVTNEIIDPNNLVFQIVSLNGGYNYDTIKTDSSFDIILENLPNNKIIKIALKITGNNYLESFSQIISSPSTYKNIHEIKLVDLNNVPDGVGVTQTTINQNNDGTIQEQVIEIPSSSSKYESSSLTIPNQTKFYDKDGNQLDGNLDITVAHFSPTNETSFYLFNTGWNVSDIVIDGKRLNDDESVKFITAGFYYIDIQDSNGNIAYSLDQNGSIDANPIVLKTSVNPELINPITNSPYAIGDTIPYWRLKNGVWEVESIAVVKDDNGSLIMEFTTSGFSKSNIDQHTGCINPSISRSNLVLPVPDNTLPAYVYV